MSGAELVGRLVLSVLGIGVVYVVAMVAISAIEFRVRWHMIRRELEAERRERS